MTKPGQHEDKAPRLRGCYERLQERHLKTCKQLSGLQYEHAVLKEYTEALAATLMHERRYGPAPGAPGTEKVGELPPRAIPGHRTLYYPLRTPLDYATAVQKELVSR